MDNIANNYELRPLYGFERMRIEEAMDQISDSLNPKIRKPIMRNLRKDLKIMIGKPGEPVVADEHGVNVIVNTLQLGVIIYTLDRCHPKSFLVEAYGNA